MTKKKSPGQESHESSLAKDAGEATQVTLPAAEEAKAKMRALLVQVQAETSRQFSGPIPPPEILKVYNEIIPGSAERILKMAEQQSAHRQGMEATVIASDAYRANAGLWLGAAVAGVSICAGSVLVALGHDAAGTTIATAVVGSLVGVFVYGSISRRQERSSKQVDLNAKRGQDL